MKSNNSQFFTKCPGICLSVVIDYTFFSKEWLAIKKDYAKRNIRNADETELFYKAQPTLTIKTETCSTRKYNKERVIVLVAFSMDCSGKLSTYISENEQNRILLSVC